MRRLGFLITAAILLLAGCRRAGEFPPAEVLRRATIASRQLQSAQFDARIAVASTAAPMRGNATATLSGRLTNGGEQTAWSVALDASFGSANRETTVRLNADVMVAFQQDAYIHLRSFDLSGMQGMPEVAALEGKWWKLPVAERQPSVQSVTPDPRFLHAQADVVRVIRDRGIETIRGRDAYRYDVGIDPDKLVAFLEQAATESGKPFDRARSAADLDRYDAKGELWIDAETFRVHRIVWMIKDKDSSRLQLELQVDLTQHDSAPPITPPKQFDILDSAAVLDQLLPGAATGFPAP